MSLGLIGKKVGMTRVFDENGASIPVTVVDVSSNEFVQIKKSEDEGYSAVQVGFGEQKEQRMIKPDLGHFKKWNAGNKRVVKEFRVASDADLPGDDVELKPSFFEKGQFVDVLGITKGQGVQGVYRRFVFGGLPMSHGSMMHRRPGGIGAGTDPGRVWKNAKMPGHMGTRSRTTQSLEVIETRDEDGVILIKGSVAGAKDSILFIRPAVKNKKKQD